MKVFAEIKKYNEDAKNLARSLGGQLVLTADEISENDLVLSYGKEGLALVCGKLRMTGDFTSMIPRVKADMWQHEMLAKAAKIKNSSGTMTAIDATAGMGEDSMILAAAGYRVKMFEYNPVIAALLKDALRRARKIPELKDIAARMEFVEGDSIAAMSAIIDPPDIIYLDPMFPGRQKSAMIKKKFQLLQKLESPCSDETEMLKAAFHAVPGKIIIKRPAKGPYLAGVKPDYSFDGKAIRYDCFTSYNNVF